MVGEANYLLLHSDRVAVISNIVFVRLVGAVV